MEFIMKAPRSVADVLALWGKRKAEIDKKNEELAAEGARLIPHPSLYQFAENIGVKKEELLGAALAKADQNSMDKVAVDMNAEVSADGIMTVSEMKSVRPVRKTAKKVAKK
jgi:hypothetical protein